MPQQSVRSKLQQKLEEIKIDEGTDWLKELVQWIVQELLDAKFSEFLGAQPHERTPKRKGYRNGYYHRHLHTRVGTLSLRVPRDREGRFSPEIFARYQRSEKALVLALAEMYVQGVSTRKVAAITERLCGTEISKDQVSACAKGLDEQLEAWRNRQLEGEYPYLMIDAKYEHVREAGQVRSNGALIVKGVRADGKREILAVDVANTENETTWSETFSSLQQRGLKGVQYLVSDQHGGLVAAVDRYFQGVAWQRCQTHYMRNAKAKLPAKQRPILGAELQDAFASVGKSTALCRLKHLVEKYRPNYNDFADWLEETMESTLTVFELPEKRRKRMKSTNGLERFNKELARRTKVVGIFPNRKSCLRLLSALAMEQSEEWLTGHRYLNMSASDEENVVDEGVAFTQLS
jgi:transposase-like protein